MGDNAKAVERKVKKRGKGKSYGEKLLRSLDNKIRILKKTHAANTAAKERLAVYVSARRARNGVNCSCKIRSLAKKSDYKSIFAL